jgi:UDP-N-acetylmuramoyl-L-alanyl-D-glutamate--2,6-diaminopimelate ligase
MFGCGGDRDATKRPLMGAIAERLADQTVVTSDNPRSESPTAIIDQIVGGMREPEKARRIEDRASAILQAVRGAAKEDVIVLAGKGHEATQEIMGKKRAFSDQDHARLALAARPTSDRHGRGGGE